MAKKRVTRHNGRAGKNGIFKANHNDRSFNIENAEHIDEKCVGENVYWDCCNGITSGSRKLSEGGDDITFSEVERTYYVKRYTDYLSGQHERNVKTRHCERDRSVDDLLKDKRFCPEETIYQIGTIDNSVSADELRTIVEEFIAELNRRFGQYVHIIDWALHVDEGTPHIHARHVFDFINRYGEIQPGQEKALEALGFELPHPEKKESRYNNRKMVFDETCRTIMFEICKEHGIDLEEEPETGGRKHIEKQDYILMKQKQTLAEQEAAFAQKKQELEAVAVRLVDAETLIDEVSQIAYDKAVDAVIDRVRAETQAEDIRRLNSYQTWKTSPERKYTSAEIRLITEVLDKAKALIRDSAKKVLTKVQAILKKPEVRTAATKQIKEQAQESVMEKLRQKQKEIAKRDAEQKASSHKRHDIQL